MKKLLAVLVLLAPLSALAQPETMMCGQDSSGNTQRLATDSSGRVVISNSSGGGVQYTTGDATTAPTGPMCMGWSGTAASALRVNSSGDLYVDVNKLIAGENLDAGYTVVHLDSTSALAANQSVVGSKTNNNAAPGATNVGALMCLANAAAPSWTEGNEVLASVDLAGNLRTNTAMINGVTPLMGNGATGTGSQRVTVASDNTTFAVGKLSHNAAAPAATSNVGALVAVANVAPPTLTETYLTAASIDLKGGLRVSTASDTTGATTEVLVLNATDTAMPTTPLAGRRGLEIQNLGPNAIYCSLTAAGSPVLTKSRMIPAVSGSWSAPFGPNIVVECRAATADQVTGAATIVTEWQ